MTRVSLQGAYAADIDVVNAARVSFGKYHAEMEPGDAQLIDFLMRNRHGTPFEHGYFKFHIAVPIFAQRDWMRHRAGHSFNEMSTRYVEMPFEVYEPKFLREQFGKPGAYSFEDFMPDRASMFGKLRHRYRRWYLIHAQKQAFRKYKRMLRRGYAKEQAMAALPMGTYTQFVWSCNPRSLMHFLSLRTEGTVRKEIREIAEQVEAEFARLMPVTHEAFVKNGRRAP